MKDNSNEIFPLVDTEGQVIGSATRGECHSGSMLLHPVVHLHLFNSQGELYLQQRPAWKDVQPSRWDSGVGGHVDYGESTIDALRRETREELGIEEFTPEYLTSYVFESSVEREYVNIFYTTYDKEVTPSAETDGGAFWSIDKIRESLNTGVFTPNFESEFLKYILPLISK